MDCADTEGGKEISGLSSGDLHGRYSWFSSLLSKEILVPLLHIYHRTRQILLCLHFRNSLLCKTCSSAPTHDDISQSLCSSLRCLVETFLCFASVDVSAIFQTQEQKVNYGDTVLSGMLDIIDANVAKIPVASDCTLPGREYLDYFHTLFYLRDDGRFATQEFSQCCGVLMRIFGNFKISLVSSFPSFRRAVSSLSGIVHSVSKLVLLLCSGNCAVGSSDFVGLRSRYAQLVAASDTDCILTDPLVEILVHCIDVWGLILGDSVLSTTATSLSKTDESLAFQLRVALSVVCGEMFDHAYQCMIVVIIQDTLKSNEEEIDVENEEISERSVYDVLRGLGNIGRLSLHRALRTVSGSLDQSVRHFDHMFSQQLATGSSVDETCFREEIVRQQEVQRLSAIFMTCLLIESENCNAMSRSSEIPLIPALVLDSIIDQRSGGGSDVEAQIIESVSLLLKTIQQQCRFHQLYSQPTSGGSYSVSQILFLDTASSELVTQELLCFLREFIR